MILVANSKLNSIEELISKALINSKISHDENSSSKILAYLWNNVIVLFEI